MALVLNWQEYDELKRQGLSDRAIARQWDIAWSTFQWHKKRRDGPPSTIHGTPGEHPPSPTDLLPSTVDRLLADIRATMTAELQPLQARLEALETAVGLARTGAEPSTGDRPPADRIPSTHEAPTVPPSTVDREAWEFRQLKHSVRWTIYVPLRMQEEIKQLAAARRQHPSLLVQELLWQALKEHSS